MPCTKDLPKSFCFLLPAVNCLDSVSWRVDYTLSSSELRQVNEPVVHLKLNVKNVDEKVTEPVTMTLSAEKFRVLLAGEKLNISTAWRGSGVAGFCQSVITYKALGNHSALFKETKYSDFSCKISKGNRPESLTFPSASF